MNRKTDIQNPHFFRRQAGSVWRASIFIGLLLAAAPLRAETVDFRTIPGPGLTLQFEEGLEGAAREVRERYPALKRDLEAHFGWQIDFRPTVVLIKTPALFRRLSGSTLIVGYAVPRDNLIVMDYSRPGLHRQRGGNVLKHEMVHLLLHRHVGGAHIPRWFDEGVAQWASEGVAELLVSAGPAILEQALLSDRTISFHDLNLTFPRRRRNLTLAYAQSRSLVTFIADAHGASKILEILERMKTGADFDEALESSLGASLSVIQKRWLESGQTSTAWWTFLARHMYLILFLTAALMTVIGFVRLLIRKRAYRDDWDDD